MRVKVAPAPATWGSKERPCATPGLGFARSCSSAMMIINGRDDDNEGDNDTVLLLAEGVSRVVISSILVVVLLFLLSELTREAVEAVDCVCVFDQNCARVRLRIDSMTAKGSKPFTLVLSPHRE